MGTERRLSSAWLEQRRALHDAYADASGLPDASRLAYLRGPEEHFSEREVVDLWRSAVEASEHNPTLNNVYVHVPFCKSICGFCNYERLRPSHPNLLMFRFGCAWPYATRPGPVFSSLRLYRRFGRR